MYKLLIGTFLIAISIFTVYKEYQQGQTSSFTSPNQQQVMDSVQTMKQCLKIQTTYQCLNEKLNKKINGFNLFQFLNQAQALPSSIFMFGILLVMADVKINQ